ncbi:MAG: hypothetical protein QNJ72_16120 [Pleurocapsa sp. MO_226.B13]|nr:hypothetical protein [Pleurocapsa sp. MO_226.B13]
MNTANSLYVGTANSFWQDEMAFNEQINSLFNNPYANGAGSFWEGEIAFMNDFNADLWQGAWEVALNTPNDQPIPGFGGIHLSNVLTGNQEFFNNDLMDTYWDGVNSSDMMQDYYLDYLWGWQDLYDPNSGTIFNDVPYADYYFYDPSSATLFGSDTYIDDPSLTQIDPYDYYGSYGLDSSSYYGYDYGTDFSYTFV